MQHIGTKCEYRFVVVMETYMCMLAAYPVGHAINAMEAVETALYCRIATLPVVLGVRHVQQKVACEDNDFEPCLEEEVEVQRFVAGTVPLIMITEVMV